MQPTRNDLPEKVRNEAATGLNQLLADAIDLSLQARQAHWNLRGAGFLSLHRLMDEVHEHASAHVDLIAERIAMLGGTAEGTLHAVMPRTRMPAYPLTLAGERQHVQKMAEALARFGGFAREAIERYARLGDPVTADLLTRVAGEADKDLWFVESHLG